jgi:hypothetical protein
MDKHAIVVLANPEAPEQHGRMIHAALLADGLKRLGAEFTLVFCGEGVRWLPEFGKYREETAHPVARHYGEKIEGVRSVVQACDFCCKRFGVREDVQRLGYPLRAEEHEHISLTSFLKDGCQMVTF